MSKKAQIGTTMTYIVATILIALLLILLFVFSNFFKKDVGGEIEVISSKEESLVSLNAYLQTPVNVSVNEKEQIITMADLIRLADLDKSYKEILKEKTKEIFDPVYEKYVIHAYPIEIVSAVGRPIFVEMFIPSKKPIQIIFANHFWS